MTVTCCVLGPLAVVDDDGNALHLGRTKPARVFATLAADWGDPVSATRLIDEVWHGSGTGENVRNAVHQLNRKVRDVFGVDHLVAPPIDRRGYRIDTGLFTLDAAVFAELYERCHDRRADLRVARDHIEQALSLWRGAAPYSDVEIPGRPGLAQHLIGQRDDLIRRRIEIDLALGLHGSVLPELDQLLRRDPFDEAVVRMLMVALYRNGNQQRALAVFGEFCTLLDGADLTPQDETCRLENRIFHRDPTLDFEPAPRPEPAGAPASSRPRPDHRSLRRLLDADIAPLYGRDADLHQLLELWDKTVVGSEPSLVLLAGHAGAGKTRLVSAFAKRLLDLRLDHGSDGVVVAVGHCNPDFTADLAPVRELVEQLTPTWPAGAIFDTLGHLSSALDDVIDQGRGATQWYLDNSDRRGRRIQAVARFVTATAQRRPVVLVVEDAQWIDRYSFSALREVLTGSVGAPVLIVATVRTELEAGLLPEVLADWAARIPTATRVELGPLPATAVVDWVTADLPLVHRHRSRDVAELVHRLTAGDPLLTGAVIDEIRRAAADDHRPFSVADLETTVPRDVTDIVTRRLRLLQASATARTTVQTAALLGPLVEVATLARLLADDEDNVSRALADCVAAELLVEIPDRFDTYAFPHDLIRRAVADSMSTGERARRHLHIAEALRRSDDDNAVIDIALHTLEAARVAGPAPNIRIDPTDIVRLAIRAGEKATETGGINTAARLYRRALAVLRAAQSDRHAECELLIRLAGVQEWTGERDALTATANEALAIARAEGDHERFARAVLAFGNHHRVVFADNDERLALLTEAWAGVKALPNALSLTVAANLLGESLIPGRYHDVGVDHEPLLRRARSTRDPEALAVTLYAVHSRLKATAAATARLDLAGELAGLGSRRHRPRPALEGETCRLYDLFALGRFTDADLAVENLAATAEETGATRFAWRAKVVKSALLRLQGDLAAADNLTSEAFVLGHSFDLADAKGVFGMQLHESQWHRGQLADLRDALRKAAATSTTVIGHLLYAHACLDEDPATARSTLATQLPRVLTLSPEELWLPTVALAAELAACLHAPEQACSHLAELLTPFSGQWVPVGIPLATWGPVDRYLALLAVRAGDDTAPALAHSALQQCRSARAPLWSERVIGSLPDVLSDQRAGRTSNTALSSNEGDI